MIKVAIASGKGGTGKTTLSTNLATYLSDRYRVILVDLDVEEPNSALFLQGTMTWQKKITKEVPRWVEERCTFCNICQQSCNFHAVLQLGQHIMVFPELCHSCYACSDLCPEGALPMQTRPLGQLSRFQVNNLAFVESRLEIGEEQAVPLIRKTMKELNNETESFDLVILDAPPGTSCPVMEATSSSDYVILITEPTPFGLHDLKLAVETMRKMNLDFGVVINRDGIGNQEVVSYCANEQIPILATIPDNRAIAEAYAEGKLLHPLFPEVASALEAIAQQLVKRIPTTGS